MAGRRVGGRRILLPDTHSHLEEAAFDGDRDAVLGRATAAGVDRILIVGSDLASSKRAIALAWSRPGVYAAVGVHPHQIERFEDEMDEIKSLLDDTKVVAVGEIGLDYYRGAGSRDQQLSAFRTQLDWARERDLPVSVHNREADGDVIRTLGESGVRGVMHCFSGPHDLAQQALELGLYVSFAGNLTFPRAENLRAVASALPIDRLLVESDAPVLAPQPWRGRRNEPAYVVATVETLATVHSVGIESMGDVLSRNADCVFGWRAA